MKLKKILYPILFLFFTSFVYAQYTITIDLIAVDQTTQKPIPFATAGFKGKNIKTIACENGRFILKYSENAIGKDDIFEVKALGYHAFSLKADRIFDFFKKPVVHLKPDKMYIGEKNTKGFVHTVHGALAGALIQVQNKLPSTVTDEKGRFRINAFEGDTLLVSYFGMSNRKIAVKDEELDVLMHAESEFLDEVVVKSDKNEADDNLDMGYSGKKNLRELGYASYYLSEDEIPDHYASLAALINGRFPGVIASENAFGTKVIMRATGSIYEKTNALFDIDGMLYEDRAPYINPQDIKSISILKSLAAVNKYGTTGRGGVIVIRTRSGSSVARPQKKALVEGNKYNENPPAYESLRQKPFYIRAFEEASSIKNARKLYSKFSNLKTERGVPFFINSSDFFAQNDQDFALDVLSEAVTYIYDDPIALRSIAFQCDRLGFYSLALQIYQRIAVLEPKKAQSYLDVAESMVDNRFYREAMQLYRKMYLNRIKNVDFSGVQLSLEAQMRNLTSVHRTKVYFKGLPPDMLATGFQENARFFVEWSDPYAEFELQFVNPMKKYFIWSHTQTGNAGRIKKEFESGFQSEPFLIDKELPGTWIVNLTNFKKSNPLNPGYLKYTLYRNYGTPQQTKTVKLIRPDLYRQKVVLDRVKVD